MKTVIRANHQSTYKNLDSLLEYLTYNNVTRIILFATNTKPDDFSMPEDGSDANFPLLWALVELELAGTNPIYIVFDGPFLTATRQPRMSEVKALLDAVINNENVYFSKERIRFLSALPPEEAVEEFLKLSPYFTPLNAASMSDFKSMLSSYWD